MGIHARWTKWNGVVPVISHRELVDRAFDYLKLTYGCTVIFKERCASGSEQPDAIGFKSGFLSVLIECKSSRSDFIADSKKLFRQDPELGLGYYRYFMAPVGLLDPTELPKGWGLLEVYEKERGRRNVVMAKDSDAFINKNNAAEVTYLVSAIRRIQISMAVFVELAQSDEDQI